MKKNYFGPAPHQSRLYIWLLWDSV